MLFIMKYGIMNNPYSKNTKRKSEGVADGSNAREMVLASDTCHTGRLPSSRETGTNSSP